jgi:hypothetical protein
MRAGVLTFVTAGLVGFASFASIANAQLIVGNDQTGTATIYNVNITTGVATPIFSGTGTNAKPWGMAYDPTSDTLYWNNGSNLFSSPMGATLTPTALGSITFNSAATNFVALGFRDGKLYGTRNIATEAVYEIDPVTRIATQVYVHPAAFDFGGLDVDSTDNGLYGLTDTNTPGLYKIDVPGQSQGFISGYPAGETDIDALAVHNGLAYYVTDGPNTTQPNFYVYNISTGQQVGTLPSPFTLGGTFAGATMAIPVPEPTSIAGALAIGAIVLRRRGR